MEIRESLESVSSESDLRRFASSNRASLDRLYEQLTRAFDSTDTDAMRQLTIKLSYVQNIEAEIYRKMPVA